MLRAHFKPSKAQAFGLGSMYAAFLVLAFMLWNNLTFQICSGLWWMWMGLSILYFVIGANKVKRDTMIAARAMPQRVYDEPRYGSAAPPTTPGSGEISLDWAAPDHPES